MKVAASSVAPGSSLNFDVCVVGAGPAGLALADSLARRGWRVGLIEAGEDTVARPGARGRRSGRPYPRLERVRAQAFGGSSTLWRRDPRKPPVDRMRARPLDAIDFEERPGIAPAWPISAADLAPWYGAAHDLSGLDGGAYGLEEWTAAGREALPLGGGVETVISQFGDPSAFVRLAEAVVVSPNVTALAGATVTDLLTEGANALSGIVVARPDGARFRVTAREYVLAAGGIETPRILLNSPIGRPGGIANRHDNVGRYFQEHLHINSGLLRPADASLFEQMGLYRPQALGGRRFGGALRLDDATQRAHGLLNSVIEFIPLPAELATEAARSWGELRWGLRDRSLPQEWLRHAANVATHPNQFLTASAARLRRRTTDPTLIQLVFTTEQSPSRASRVTLARQFDAFGNRLPHLHWRIEERDLESLRATQDLFDAACRGAGIGAVQAKWGDVRPAPRIYGCNHAIGTTRMSTHPEDGVVGANCRVHGMANLSIAGSSVMPTGGAITVTTTLVALALRLGSHLDTALSADRSR